MNVFHRNEAIDAMLEAHAAGKISNENLSVGGEMIAALYDAQPVAELSKWDSSPRIIGEVPASAVWTSYRDGRRVMHYTRDAKGRYYVQKVESGYKVSYMADAGDGTSVRLSVQPTLAAGKKWVADHVEAASSVGYLTLAEIKAKFEDEPMYECEIPGTPGRVTLAACKAAVGEPLPRGTDTSGLPSGVYVTTLEAVGVAPSGDIIASAIVHGFGSRCIQIVGRCQRIRPHRPKVYKPHSLGIDTSKVTYSARCNSLEDLRHLDAQDARVCRIEQELVQYAGRRRTPHRNRKVNKLRKILRILKRGIYC